jgi:subtilisin family serine protease
MISLLFLIVSVFSRAFTRTPIPNQFIVVLKTHIINVPTTTNELLFKLSSSVLFASEESPEQVHQYNLPTFKGFSLKLPQSFVGNEEDLKAMLGEEVAYIQQDQKVHTYAEQTNAIWNLRRLSSAEKTVITDPYQYPDSAGNGVDVYIIDSGIKISHSEFQGRAIWGQNFSDDGIDRDELGHGTHVAGTVGSLTYGVAKKVNLIAIKI